MYKRQGYDEYRFDLDEIGHDPYVLTSILSALHEGVYTLGDVQGDLAMLFEKQYTLTQTIETETRYRTETRTDKMCIRDRTESARLGCLGKRGGQRSFPDPTRKCIRNEVI